MALSSRYLLALLPLAWSWYATAEELSPSAVEQAEALIRSGIEQFADQTPLRVGRDTVLTDAYLDEEGLKYVYALDRWAEARTSRDQFMSETYQRLSESICSVELLALLLERGKAVEYRYMVDEKPFGIVRFSGDFCKAQKQKPT